MMQTKKLSPRSLLLSLTSSASLASIMPKQSTGQMRPTMATKQGKKGQKVLCSTMDGMGGPETPGEVTLQVVTVKKGW